MQMFSAVFMQVVVLMILMSLGFILSKAKVVNDNGIKNITEMVLLFVTPSVIIKSFIREFNIETLKSLGISFLVAIAPNVIFMVLRILLLRTKDITTKKILQFSVIFSNSGFMALPLQQSLLGEDGVFYCSSFITIFNIFIWTYGLVLIGGKENLNVKKVVLNPGIIAFLIGVVIFVFSVPVPSVIEKPLEYMAALNTPLPMIVIGYHLANCKIKKVFKSFASILAITLRMVIFPFIIIGLMYVCGIKDSLFVSTAISACAPTAAMATMFASKFDSDVELSVAMVSVTTILSVITMPLIITFAQLIA